MPVLPILTGSDNPALRIKTKPVAKVTKDVLKLVKDLRDTTDPIACLGIAAPQVGREERVCLAMINKKMTPLINPQITWKGEKMTLMEEGCLSLPGAGVDVPRHLEITLTYLDEKGNAQERMLKGIDARVVQHEVDHLDGVLIVDYR